MADIDGIGDRPWRVGRKVGRTIYDLHDRLIGTMDTPAMAHLVVTAVNLLDKGGAPHCDWCGVALVEKDGRWVSYRHDPRCEAREGHPDGESSSEHEPAAQVGERHA